MPDFLDLLSLVAPIAVQAGGDSHEFDPKKYLIHCSREVGKTKRFRRELSDDSDLMKN